MPSTIAKADIDRYLRQVAGLYDDVRRWITELEPSAKFTEAVVELAEEMSGPYKAPTLEVSWAPFSALRFVPRARYMLGGEGCVNARGRFGTEMLVWVSEGAPEISFRFNAADETVEEIKGPSTLPMFREGWAWSDQQRLGALVHLDRDVFRENVLGRIGR